MLSLLAPSLKVPLMVPPLLPPLVPLLVPPLIPLLVPLLVPVSAAESSQESVGRTSCEHKSHQSREQQRRPLVSLAPSSLACC